MISIQVEEIHPNLGHFMVFSKALGHLEGSCAIFSAMAGLLNATVHSAI